MSRRILTPLAAALLFGAAAAQAIETVPINSPSGRTVFEARFFGVDDGPYAFDEDEALNSAWAWEPFMQNSVARGLQYWAEIIQPASGAAPAVINIGTDKVEDNAFAFSPAGNQGNDSRTLVQRQLQGLPVDESDLVVGGHGLFGLGRGDYPLDLHFNQVPMSGKDDLVGTAIHELGHALGVSSMAENKGNGSEEEYRYEPRFGKALSGWAPLMVDDNGRPARPNQAILCNGCDNAYDPDGFDARADRSMLVGPNIADALAGGLPGVPVSMYYRVDDEVGVDDNTMSHIELRNSMMSHQNYRNYTAFMEAELAVLQDIGYTIDRRNFFGRSVYGSGLDIVNDRGFFARNADGTQYLAGRYNMATLGLGLHVYGDHNRVRQVADILAAGEGGAGIRVDGEGNTLIVDRGVRVHANGAGGQGVMFAYGRNHTLVHRGDVEALGERGVGLRFDFGSNALSNAKEHRGSYIRTYEGSTAALLPELQGSLVNRADITGRVAGREAAIYISGNAHVGSVNIMNGARIQGDIVSHYAERDASGNPRLTTVSFGQRPDTDGGATGQPDPDFRMSYAGNMRGKDNLMVSFDGGETRLSGRHQVLGAVVQAPATLSGTSAFQLTTGGVFVNEGTLAPGASVGRMTIDGDFRQSPTGRVMAEFDALGVHDVLEVSGTVDLAGTLELAPLPDAYVGGWTQQTGSLVSSAAQRGEFDTVTFAATSPTLRFSATLLGHQRYGLSAVRAQDAYSQYASDANGREAGRAVQQLALASAADVGGFFRALDFSAPDGSDVARALTQVSPQGYSAGLAASLLRERDVMARALRGFNEGLRPGGSDWQGFAVAFGGEGRQKLDGSAVGYDSTTYGLIVGGGRRLASHPDVSVAVHMDVAEQSIKLKSPLWGKGETTAFGVGAQVQYRADALEGLHAAGGIRFGLEHGSMDRHVAVGDYQARHSADWTGRSASAQVGAGYRSRLSDAVSAGPFASLNYARVSRPGVSESGPNATRLQLDRQHADALRSSLGVGLTALRPLADGAQFTAQTEISWDHEWLDRNVVQTARFASAAGAAVFDTTNALLPRDTLGLRASVGWTKDRLSVGAGLGGRLGSDYKAVEGQVSLRWAF